MEDNTYAMVRKSVQARARATNVTRSGGDEGVLLIIDELGVGVLKGAGGSARDDGVEARNGFFNLPL